MKLIDTLTDSNCEVRDIYLLFFLDISKHDNSNLKDDSASFFYVLSNCRVTSNLHKHKWC